MKFKNEHAISIILIGFLVAAPLVAASGNTLAQDEFLGEDLFEGLLTNGAELMFSMIDEQGVPSAIYGQLGIPSDDLDLDAEMYEGCIAMALISTHGEFLDIVLELVGGDLFGGEEEGGEFALAQDGGFNPDSILEMIGTEFNLLINIFVNVDEATSNARMGSILNHLQTQFGFGFVEIFKIRIDESLFPPEAEIELPFDSIDVFIYQETHEFGVAVDRIFDVMDGSGFLSAIDTSIFSNANAAAAGLLAIPDIADLVDLIESFSSGDGGGEEFLPALVQDGGVGFLENVTGPIAIAAAGYLGEQLLSTDSTSLNVGDLFGITGSIEPFTTANSLILTSLPENLNVTSIVPNVANQSFYDNESNMVIWNATALGTQSEYIINFEADFPPLITIARTFSPDTTVPGGSTTVTVTVTNEGDEAIGNLVIADDELASTYSTVSVTGTTTDTVLTLAGGASATIEYQVTFTNEGGYSFAPVEISYEYESETFYKDSHTEGYIVQPDVGGLFIGGIMSGMPYTGIALGVVALVGIYSILGIFKGRGGDTFQV
ncbi:MAG: DUF11 domain-containing protein [Candidatus Thorarchaeota archaeon]|nr:DUF11 domain-containing protein [Candidatus Thorarchaeota archaeon]